MQNYQGTGTKDSSAPTGLWIVLAAFPRIPPSLRSGSILGYYRWPLRGQIIALRGQIIALRGQIIALRSFDGPSGAGQTHLDLKL